MELFACSVRSSFVSAFAENSARALSIVMSRRRGSSFLAKTLFHVPAELQHGACAALKAHRGQQRRAVCKQAGGCGGLVFLRECFVSLFEDDRVADEDSRKQQKQQCGNEDDPERGLVEKPGALAAVRGVVFRIVRFRVVLLQLLALRYARAVAGCLPCPRRPA